MSLVRNLTEDGKGKYAVVRLDKIRGIHVQSSGTSLINSYRIDQALKTLEECGVIEYGEPHSENEFFVIKLKDINAEVALEAYAISAAHCDSHELAQDVRELAARAGENHPLSKKPD